MQYFVEHTITINQTTSKTHVFAFVKWAKPHHAQEYWFGQSAIVCEKEYEEQSFCNYIPIQRILCVCAHADLELQFDLVKQNVFVAIPTHVLSAAHRDKSIIPFDVYICLFITVYSLYK